MRTIIRRHAIFKREYRRVVDKTVGFHDLNAAEQWALLRGEVLARAPEDDSTLLAILDSREPRREQVLAGLEDGRRGDIIAAQQTQDSRVPPK